VNASTIRKDDDYFACDDMVIRSPTYYTKTNVESKLNNYSTDLKSLLQPMFPDYEEENKTTEDGSQQDGSTRNTKKNDEAIEFERRIEQSI
jgi:hypothetical protein